MYETKFLHIPRTLDAVYNMLYLKGYLIQWANKANSCRIDSQNSKPIVFFLLIAYSAQRVPGVAEYTVPG